MQGWCLWRIDPTGDIGKPRIWLLACDSRAICRSTSLFSLSVSEQPKVLQMLNRGSR